MKTKIAFTLLFSLPFCLLSSQVPQGFNYQAIARDVSGNPIANATINVKLSILKDTTGFFKLGTGNYIWEEEHTNVKTNAVGLFVVILGDPSAGFVQGSASSFSNIDWTKIPLYIGTKIGNPSPYKILGAAQLWSVPYAEVSQRVSGLKSLSVVGETTINDSALFEVKNNLGKTVFAVYNQGIRVHVAPGDAGGGNKGTTKGGFAIGGFDIAKGTPGQPYFKVYPDSTRVYVKNPTGKGATKGGFAIGGFDGAKGTPTGNFMDITPKNYLIGHEAGLNIATAPTPGLYNSLLGYKAGRNTSSGSYNTIMGYKADSALTTGSNNIVIGATAGFMLTTGNHNTLIGSSAGYNHTNQNYNVMIGTSAGFNVTGSYNTFMGINSGYKIKAGINNTFLGTNAGAMLESGSGNTIIGIDAGRSGTWDPGLYHTDFSTNYNTIIGNNAGYSLDVGDGNVFIGYGAGESETGTVLAPASNKLYISSTLGTLIYGDFSTSRLGIGTFSLTKTLNVGGDVSVTGDVSSNTYNGMSLGKIYLTADGDIMSTYAGAYVLHWIKATGEIYIYNYSTTDKCEYWTRTSGGTVSSGSLAAGGTASAFISGIGFSDGVGAEIHFGSAHGQQGWCSVWVEYGNGRLVGHYMKY
jgi:hypothetical protein